LIVDYYAGCRALIFPGEEDFGIVPVEAMACGKPVIAFGKGGALETVIDGTTGILFSEQNKESMESAIRKFTQLSFDGAVIRNHALQFDKHVFVRRVTEFIQKVWDRHQSSKGARVSLFSM
jgi:glycosyltransferase involved in cell wall biosynthesis